MMSATYSRRRVRLDQEADMLIRMHLNGGQPARAPESVPIRVEDMTDGVRYEGVCDGKSQG